MSVLNPVPSDPITKDNNASQAFRIFLTKLYLVVFSITESGITADRPIKSLWIGRIYFDTTLNKPIWVKTISPVAWIKADGTAA